MLKGFTYMSKLFPKRDMANYLFKNNGLLLSWVTLTLALSILFLCISWHNSRAPFSALPSISCLWYSHPRISIRHRGILRQCIFPLQLVKVHNLVMQCGHWISGLTNQNASLSASNTTQHSKGGQVYVKGKKLNVEEKTLGIDVAWDEIKNSVQRV